MCQSSACVFALSAVMHYISAQQLTQLLMHVKATAVIWQPRLCMQSFASDTTCSLGTCVPDPWGRHVLCEGVSERGSE